MSTTGFKPTEIREFVVGSPVRLKDALVEFDEPRTGTIVAKARMFDWFVQVDGYLERSGYGFHEHELELR